VPESRVTQFDPAVVHTLVELAGEAGEPAWQLQVAEPAVAPVAVPAPRGA
jgi:hypothetical protein